MKKEKRGTGYIGDCVNWSKNFGGGQAASVFFLFYHALRGEAVVWIRIMELDKQEFKSKATECL